MLLLCAGGCASLEPIGSVGDLELEPNQGILVVHVTTAFPVERLEIGSGGVLESLTPGEHVGLFVAKGGHHRWTGMVLPFLRYRIRRDDEWRFRVEPGRVSYPGMLELRKNRLGLIRARTVDRSAMALESIRGRHPGLLERFPIVYTGSGRNVFFDQLRAVQPRGGEERVARPAPPAAAGNGR